MSAIDKQPLLVRPYLPEKPIKHPYDLPPKIPAYTRLYHPSSAGILTASLATFGSTIELPSFVTSPCRSVAWLWEEDTVAGRVLRIIPGRLCVTIVAFFCGFVTFKCLDWARWRTLKSLLNYRGWMYSPTSVKTKVRLRHCCHYVPRNVEAGVTQELNAFSFSFHNTRIFGQK